MTDTKNPAPQNNLVPAAYRHRLAGSLEWNVSNADDMDGVRDCMRQLGDRLEVEALFVASASETMGAACDFVKMAGSFHKAIEIIQQQMKDANYAMVSNEPLAFISMKTLGLLIDDKSGDYRMTAPRDEDGPKDHALFTWPTPAPDVNLAADLIEGEAAKYLPGGPSDIKGLLRSLAERVRALKTAPQPRERT